MQPNFCGNLRTKLDNIKIIRLLGSIIRALGVALLNFKAVSQLRDFLNNLPRLSLKIGQTEYDLVSLGFQAKRLLLICVDEAHLLEDPHSVPESTSKYLNSLQLIFHQSIC